MAVARKRKIQPESRTPSLWNRLVIIVFEALPLLLIFVGVAYGLHTLWQNAQDKHRYKVKPVSVIADSDKYCPEALKEFQRLAKLSKGRSLLDPLVLRSVRREYEQSPWVRAVCTVRRVFPDRIMVSFIARRSFAQVKEDGYYWLVDEDGVLLPVEGVRKLYPNLPVICGSIGKRPENGVVWQDRGVIGALNALMLVKKSNVAKALPVEGIRVCRESFLDRLSRPGMTRPRLEIITSNGVTILWGPAGEKLPGEIEDREKVSMLRQLVAECGTNPGLRFDIRTNVPGYSYEGRSRQ